MRQLRSIGGVLFLVGTGLVVYFGWGNAGWGLKAGVLCSYAALFIQGLTWGKR